MVSTTFLILSLSTYLILIPWKSHLISLEADLGKKLLWSIYQMEEEVFCGQIPSSPRTSEYKFFSFLLNSFVFYSRDFGIPLMEFLKELKNHLRRDLQLEKKIGKEFRDGIFQFLFITFVSLLFWRWSYFLLEIKVKYSINFFFGVFLEVIGLGVFILNFWVLRERLLKQFRPIFSAYYIFWGLSSVGLPIVEVLGKSRILEVKPKNKGLKALQKRMENLVTSWKDKGFPVKEEVEGIIWELWEQYEEDFRGFRITLKIVNFLIMALFYLSAFFILLLDFVGIFLIELK